MRVVTEPLILETLCFDSKWLENSHFQLHTLKSDFFFDIFELFFLCLDCKHYWSGLFSLFRLDQSMRLANEVNSVIDFYLISEICQVVDCYTINHSLKPWFWYFRSLDWKVLEHCFYHWYVFLKVWYLVRYLCCEYYIVFCWDSDLADDWILKALLVVIFVKCVLYSLGIPDR